MNKSNLGQNAAQMKCLFLNLPFILIEYENDIHLKKIWRSVTSLLDILHIVYSDVNDESMIQELKKCIVEHLKLIEELFEAGLIPKHHFLTH